MHDASHALQSVEDFDRSLAALIAQIPLGWVATYGELAAALGDVRAARAVAERCADLPAGIPVHRVVDRRGRACPAAVERLAGEGIALHGSTVAQGTRRFVGFEGDRPLRTLQRLQATLAAHVVCEGEGRFDRVAGIDVSYRRDAAVAAAVVMEGRGRVREEATVRAKPGLPYIPTYLGFRELPPVQAVCAALGRTPSLLVVDGNGILHPRGLGSASHIGVVLDMPTIGVAKRLLCGTVCGGPPAAAILLRGRQAGWALWGGAARRPVFVSPGHRVSLAAARRIVEEFLTHRVPEPIRRADALCRRAWGRSSGEDCRRGKRPPPHPAA